MTLPNSYKDITVEKYQEIYPTIQLVTQLEGLESLDQWVKIISSLSGKSVEQVEAIELDKLKSYIKQLSFLLSNEYKLVHKHVWIKGFYKAVNKAERLNTAQYVSIKTFLQDGKLVDNLHHIAACSYKKLTLKGWKYKGNNHDKLSEAFLKMPCHKVLPLVFFCLTIYKYWMENTEVYLSSQRIIKQREREIAELIRDPNFINIGVGTLQ